MKVEVHNRAARKGHKKILHCMLEWIFCPGLKDVIQGVELGRDRLTIISLQAVLNAAT